MSGKLYPVVGMRSRGSCIRVNFGLEHFQYDVNAGERLHNIIDERSADCEKKRYQPLSKRNTADDICRRRGKIEVKSET